MKNNLIIRSCALLLTILFIYSFSEPGIKIHGKITGGTQGPVTGASVTLFTNGIIDATFADIDGNYSFSITDQTVDSIFVTAIGFNTKKIKFIRSDSAETIVNIDLEASTTRLNEVTVTDYRVPLLDVGQTSRQARITREEIHASPARSIAGVVQQSAGVFKINNDNNIRGSRDDATVYYVDGIKVNGNPGIDYKYDKSEEQYDKIAENNFQSSQLNPLSTFSIDVDKASYSNIRRIIKDGFLPPADAVRIEEMINYFRYSYPVPDENAPLAMRTELGACPWNPSHQLLNIGLKAKDIADETLPASNLVFLLDVSGSMDSPNKLPLVQKSIGFLVDNLREKDMVAIVVYAGAAGMVLKPTNCDKKEKIIEAVENLHAGGSTAGAAGIMLAYSLAKENFDAKKNNRIILCTDGDFNVGISDDDDLVRMIEQERDNGIFLSVLGFGMGNYKDSKMEKLADKGNGNYAYIYDLSEARKVFVTEMKGSLYTLAKDVKLQIEFNPSVIRSYRLIGYENRVLAAEDFNDDRKDAGELGAGMEVTALYELVPAVVEEKSKVDDLKYRVINNNNSLPDEVATIRFRYKDPLDSKSKLLSNVVKAEITSEEKLSEDFRFASAVAEAGMLLRQSEFKGTANFKHAIQTASASKGSDEEGYRSEFVQLMKQVEVLDRKLADRK